MLLIWVLIENFFDNSSKKLVLFYNLLYNIFYNIQIATIWRLDLF